VISQLEPRIVVPMHYALNGQMSFTSELAPVDKFTQELGLKEFVTETKLSLNKSSLPGEGEQTRIIIMQPDA